MIESYLRKFFNIGLVDDDQKSDREANEGSSQENVDESSFESEDDQKQLLFYVDPQQKNKLVVMPQGEAYNNDEVMMIFSKLIEHGRKASDLHIAVEASSAIVSLFSPYIERRKGNGWLNERVVDRWFDMLSQIYKGKRVANIHSWWQEDYIKSLGAGGARQKDRSRLLQSKLMFWPIARGDHWYLLMIQKQGTEFTISCLDGFNLHEKHTQLLNLGEKLVKTLFGASSLKIHKESLSIPIQDGSEDCGPVICLLGERACQGRALEGKGLCDYKQVRLYIAEKLASLTPQAFLNGYIAQGQRRRQSAQKSNDITKQSSVPKVIIDLENTEKEPSLPRKLRTHR
jgi:hypothetical protein